MDLTSLTIGKAARQIQQGELSLLALTEAHLARIARLDRQLNSFITLAADEARQRAQALEVDIQQGRYRSPLHGIPLALKDIYEVRGWRTTLASKVFADRVSDQDAHSVSCLLKAGAVLLGKLNMHEIALGVTNVNPHYGPCHNPWDLSRVSGGSSGGSAAAVAAGLCMGALGSDTGGSIRIPAALCGVVGLKPTRGRVSVCGVLPLSWNLDHAGPLARRVEDIAWLLTAMAGYDRQDPASQDRPVEDYPNLLAGGVSGWRIGLASGEFFREVTDPEVTAALEQAARTFKRLGAHLSPVELPQMRPAATANGLMVVCDAATIYRQTLETTPEVFGDDVRQRLLTGSSTPVNDYIQARHTQQTARRAFEQVFEAYDLLLMPTTPVPAPPFTGPDAVEQARLLTRFTAPFNLTGLPAISVPCGFTSQGLPVGMQLVAPAWAESRLLRAAYTYQQETSWHRVAPEIERM